MKVFVIERENYSWCDNYRAVVVAEDALHAERRARLNVGGWEKVRLYPPEEIDLNKEQVVSVENVGM